MTTWPRTAGTPAWSLLLFLSLFFLPQAASAEYPSLSAPPSLEAFSDGDVAVIIAIEEYDRLTPIRGAYNNAHDWDLFFRDGLGVSQVFMLLNEQATDIEIERIAQIAAEEVADGGRLWFLFIGHGITNREGSDGLLVGADARQQMESLYSRSVPQQRIIDILQQGSQAETILIVDACFSGRDSAGEALVDTLATVPLHAIPRIASQTVILSAAASDEFAGFLPGHPRPAFSYLLLGALRGWAAAPSGEVRASDAVDFARRSLRGLPGWLSQTPSVQGEGDLVLVRNVQERDPGIRRIMENQLRSPSSTPSPRPQEFDDPGVLHVINSTPSTLSVFVDGEPVGAVPGQVAVPADREFTARFESPGYQPLERTFRIGAGEIEQIRNLRLEQLPGRLVVRSNVHDARINVNGRTLGRTRINRPVEVEVPAGSLSLEFSLDGYETLRRTVTVTPGGSTSVDGELELRDLAEERRREEERQRAEERRRQEPEAQRQRQEAQAQRERERQEAAQERARAAHQTRLNQARREMEEAREPYHAGVAKSFLLYGGFALSAAGTLAGLYWWFREFDESEHVVTEFAGGMIFSLLILPTILIPMDFESHSNSQERRRRYYHQKRDEYNRIQNQQASLHLHPQIFHAQNTAHYGLGLTLRW